MMMALDISARTKIEEQLMITRCGDQYLEYISRTGRIFTGLGKFPGSDFHIALIIHYLNLLNGQ